MSASTPSTSQMADAPGGPWNHAFVTTPYGHRIHYVHDGPVDAMPVVLVHGWPDLWFGWRRQIKALSSSYRVIVPDLRGFGQSSTPLDVAAYGAKNVTNDLAALLDALDIEKAVFIGHDWGGAMVWRMCLYHPARVIAVCGVCTPYTPPSKTYVDLDTVIKFLPPFEYQRFLADTKLAGETLDTSPRRLFTAFFRRYHEGAPRAERLSVINQIKGVKDSPHWLFTKKSSMISDEEMEYYVQQYTHAGFQSSCSYYATRQIDFDTERGLPVVLPHRALFIGAGHDGVLRPEMARKMPQVMPRLEMKLIKEAGHWVLVEQSEEVNSMLLEWLAKIRATGTESTVAQAKL